MPLQPVCEAHPQISGRSAGLQLRVRPPQVDPEPVLVGDTDADGSGASIYGSVIADGGRFRMWYQAWPRDWDYRDVVTVACAESDDGVVWRRPAYGVLECGGSRANHLTDLPFHCPSVFIDPQAPTEARYRAFGYTSPAKLDPRFAHHRLEAPGYYTAYSADGLRWTVDGSTPLWPWGDVISAVWDPWSESARIALKRGGQVNGMHRRRFYTATWAAGQASAPVSALLPDELDDWAARQRGFVSADYYGVALLPTPGPTLGMLWNFRHLPPLGVHPGQLLTYGATGSVDLTLVCQPERGGRWLHLPGRPDWLPAAEAPAWAQGALYTAASPLDVGDQTWLYVTGTADQHGYHGHGVEERDGYERGRASGGFCRIGRLSWPRGRLIGWHARQPERLQLTPAPGPGRLAVNAVCGPQGHLRAALLDRHHEPLPGFGLDDCDPVGGQVTEAVLRWRQDPSAWPASGCTGALLELTGATLYAFDFTCP